MQHYLPFTLKLSALVWIISAFVFLAIPHTVAEATCGTIVPTTATVYYPMEALNEGNSGTGGGGATTHTGTSTVTSIATSGTNAINIDTGDSVSFPNTTTVNQAFSQRTYELWFVVSSVTGTQQIFEHGGSWKGGGMYLVDDTLYGGVWGGNGGEPTAAQLAYATITGIQANTVYHVFMTYDTGTLTLYVNSFGSGTQSDTQTTSGITSIGAGNNGNLIGGINGNTYQHTGTVTAVNNFDGIVDEFAIYDGTAYDTVTINAAFDSCVPTAVTMSGFSTHAAAYPVIFITLSTIALGTLTALTLRRKQQAL
ncbi:MAG: LamG domain-containing protein [Anaerolineales bacterium]|nr:LamG domain-containing protein [Anaerolineales bacterium]